MYISICLFILALKFSFVNAKPFVPPVEFCLPSSGLKELTGCIAMVDKEEECSEKASDDEKLDCFCTQEMLSSYFDCQSEVQRCLESHMFDAQFDVKVRDWHATCDGRLTTSMTTPAEPTLTTTYDFRACNRLDQSCMSADYETKRGSSKYPHTSSISFTSCAWQPRVYSLCSECQFNGIMSCLRTPAAEFNIWGYSFCSNFWSSSNTLASADLTSFISTTYSPQTEQATIAPTVKPASTGFVTSIAKQTGGSGQKAANANVQEEL